MHKQFSLFTAVLMLAFGSPVHARQGEAPFSVGPMAKRMEAAPEVRLPAIDAAALRRDNDAIREKSTAPRSKRLQVAVDTVVDLDTLRYGEWRTRADGSLMWRLRVHVPGATDLHLGFETYRLVAGAAVWVIGADDYYEGPYTVDDAGPLWVPVLPGDTATIELRLPAGAAIHDVALGLTNVGAGFRHMFGTPARNGSPGSSGPCNINVVCPLGQPYSAEARALAYYEFRADTGGTFICTATLMNDVPADRKNYVLTAAHCFATPSEAASMRLYWNYRSTSCAGNTGIQFTQNQTGTTLRATRADADFTLVELNQNPDPAWNLFHAGWDASNIAPSGSIGLHHPSGDAAKVNNNPNAPFTTNNCIGTGGGSLNTHWYTGPYDQGTTEGGSSGSGLWIPAASAGGNGRRLIGVLSGGTALCAGPVPDNGFDCYGKFSAAWNGPAASSRLRDWLDPASTGTLSLAGVDKVTIATGASDPALAARAAAERLAAPARPGGRGLPRHVRPSNLN